jgi:hypothetical protein
MICFGDTIFAATKPFARAEAILPAPRKPTFNVEAMGATLEERAGRGKEANNTGSARGEHCNDIDTRCASLSLARTRTRKIV